MFTLRALRGMLTVLGVILGASALASSALAADMVQVKNTNTKLNWILSDLVVYGPNGEKVVVLKPGDPSDDISIPPGGVSPPYGPFDFQVTKYFVSTTVAGQEFESFVLNVVPLEPRKIGMLQDLKTKQPIVLVIDDQLANFNPELGAKLSFRNGASPTNPGIYAAMIPNFEQGTVQGPYTGRAVIVDADAEVIVFPAN